MFADPENPQSWNLYSYGLNNPLVYSDPDGHEPCENDVDPENGNFCTVATAKKPSVETQSSPIGPLIIPLLVNTVQVAQKTQELVQPVADWLSRPRNPICTAGYGTRSLNSVLGWRRIGNSGFGGRTCRCGGHSGWSGWRNRSWWDDRWLWRISVVFYRRWGIERWKWWLQEAQSGAFRQGGCE